MAPINESLESFGSYLKRERELREIPLEEIAAYTRIKPRALMAIENDDFASLPALTFVRAFTRCYADYIGLNVPDVMLRFDAFVQNRYPELTGEVPILPKKEQPRQRYLTLAFLFLALLLAALYYWLQGAKNLKPPETPAVHQPAPVAARPSGPLPPTAQRIGLPPPTTHAPEPEEAAPSPGPAAAENDAGETTAPARPPRTSTSSQPLGPPRSLATIVPGGQRNPASSRINYTLTITVDRPCWIQYLIDSDDARQTILQPDQTVTFAAASLLRISFGKPEAIQSVKYNGAPYRMGRICFPFWITIPPDPNDVPCQPATGG